MEEKSVGERRVKLDEQLIETLPNVKGGRYLFEGQNWQVQQNTSTKFDVEAIRKFLMMKLGKEAASECVEEEIVIKYNLDEDKLLKVLSDHKLGLEALDSYIKVTQSKKFIRGYKAESKG